MTERLLGSLILVLVGLAVGFLAQRSRMCFVAGWRDYFLVRDTELLTGFFSFLVTTWVLTSLFYSLNLLQQRMPEYGTFEFRAAEGRAVGAGLAGRLSSFFRREATGGAPVPLFGLFGRFFWVSLAGGGLIGLLSVWAEGCVLRQHVLCAQGNRNALFFILGFYGAAVAYSLLFADQLNWLYQ